LSVVFYGGVEKSVSLFCRLYNFFWRGNITFGFNYFDKLQQTKQESKKKIYTKEMLQQMAKKLAEKLEKAKSNKI